MTSSWISKAVIYQINLRSLCFREPRNAIEALLEEENIPSSPFDYLTGHLETLKTLGVTTLHIMPPYLMGKLNRKGIGSPYAAADYQAVDPEYGTIEQFKKMIRKAHELGFTVILGMVPNHTSRDNVWIYSNPEFYVKNEQGEITFDLDWSDTAKLDYTHPGLRKAMYDVYDFWLSILDGETEGVDGFRIDMAHFINDRTFWNDTLPALKKKYNREILFLAECYGIDNSMDLFKRGFNGSYDDAYYKLLEHYYGVDPEGNSVLFRPDHHPENTTHSPLYEDFKQQGFARVAGKLLTDYEDMLPTIEHPVYMIRYTDNHDEGRGIYRFGPQAVKAMNQLLFFSSHCVPFLFTGQEFGAANRPSIHNRFSLCDKGPAITDGETIWFKDGIEFEGNSFIRETAARKELLHFYKELIQLRKAYPALQTGSFTLLDIQQSEHSSERNLMAFERKLDGTTLRCAINLGSRAIKLQPKDLFAGERIYGQTTAEDTLPPFSAIITRNP